jgi:hypothetical protein
MTEGDPVAGGKRAGFEQRILHPRHLLLHSFQGLADYRGPYLASAQVPHLLDLQKIKKRIALGGCNQPSLFPS